MISPTLDQQLQAIAKEKFTEGDNIVLQTPTVQRYAREVASLVLTETRERAADLAREHSCKGYSENCDCGGYIAAAICASDPETPR